MILYLIIIFNVLLYIVTFGVALPLLVSASSDVALGIATLIFISIIPYSYYIGSYIKREIVKRIEKGGEE